MNIKLIAGTIIVVAVTSIIAIISKFHTENNKLKQINIELHIELSAKTKQLETQQAVVKSYQEYKEPLLKQLKKFLRSKPLQKKIYVLQTTISS